MEFSDILLIIWFSLLCVWCVVFSIFIKLKCHTELQELRTKRLIRKLTRKYMRLYRKEIKNSKIISMRDYVIDLVQTELSYMENTYVKTIYKLYETERRYLPKV